MATRTVTISSILGEINNSSTDVHEAVLEVANYVVYGKMASSYPVAAESADLAILKATTLLEQLCALRSALIERKPSGLAGGGY